MGPRGFYHLGFVDAYADTLELRAAFIQTPQYDELVQRDRCFVAGRRGSGKSAHAMKLLEQWEIATLCSDPDAQFDRYQEIVDSLVEKKNQGATINIQRGMQSLWTHALRVLIFQAVVDHRAKLDDPTRAVPYERYLRDRSILDAAPGQILMRGFRPAMDAASATSTFGLALAHEFTELEADRPARDLMDALPSVLGTKRILILVDSHEQYAIYMPEMQEALGGITRAIVGIKAGKASSNVDIRFFLPAEIFEYISPEMPGKVLGETVFLRWKFHHLVALLTLRFFDMLRRNGLEPGDKLARLQEIVRESLKSDTQMRTLRRTFWYDNGYFPNHVQNNLGHLEDTFAYLLRHTQRRPRELIFVLNQIIDQALGRKELPRLSQDAVKLGLHDTQTLQFLVRDSLSPFLAPKRDMLDLTSQIFQGRTRVFNGRELLRWTKRLRDLQKLPDDGEEGVIQVLLRAGVIGQVEPKPARHYTLARFEYLMQDHLQFIAEHAQNYCIHPSVGDFCRMETQKEQRVIYPLPETDVWLEEDLNLDVR